MEESERLRQENDDLQKVIEQLQADRCIDVEELVYLRWINACLRYELRNFQPTAGKTVARDLSKSLSPKSEEKAKQLILEYANTEGIGGREMSIAEFDSGRWSSSQASFLTDSGEFDESSVDISSAAKTNTSSKKKIFSKLRRLLRGKDNQHNNQVLSTEKSGSVEDSDSPLSSSIFTGFYPEVEGQNNRFATPPQRSRRSSLDLSSIKSLKEEHIKDIDSFRRSSDVGSSHRYKRDVSSREGAVPLTLKDHLDLDSDSTEKSELVKYATALKGSRRGTTYLNRKSHKSF